LIHTLHGQRGGTATAALVEQRRAAVRSYLSEHNDSQAIARIESAPLAYLLAQDPATAARHLRLVARVAAHGGVAAQLHHPDPARSGRVEHAGQNEQGPVNGAMSLAFIDIVARDAIGLLARSTGVVEDLGLSIVDATVATWSDGCALQSFAVTAIGGRFPEEAEVALDVSTAMASPLHSAGVGDAVLRFDNSSSPWHTIVEVRATDRPGLLHAVAAAFAVCGVDVHAAQISTADELVFDIFEVTSDSGSKLGAELQLVVTETVRVGVSAKDARRISRKAFSKRNRPNTLGTRTKQSGPSAEISRS
jgi:UTP:GlnB (protein PII) uridylyltransferase